MTQFIDHSILIEEIKSLVFLQLNFDKTELKYIVTLTCY